MTRPVQYFTDEYLVNCKKMSPASIARFLEDFRLMAAERSKTNPQKLISIKMPQELLRAFRGRCEVEGCKYQTKIKELMIAWLREG
jgi:hypothetical protein